MATNYKNILLKDNTGKILLPITLSYYVEYRDGLSVQAYLDTLSAGINSANSSIDSIEEQLADNATFQENIVDSINNVVSYFTSYVQKPDYASYVVFTKKDTQSDALKNLPIDQELGYTSTQQAIEALDTRITSTNSYASELGNRIDTIDSDISALETSLSGIDTRIGNVETQSDYSYSKINVLFDESGNLDLAAGAVKYTGNAESGTETLVGNKANVQDAIDYLGSALQKVNTDIEAALSGAGVTYVTGQGGILVNDRNNERQDGSVVVKLNLDNDKVILSGGAVTVDDSKLSITASQISDQIDPSQIAGGLGANNINVTYTYLDGDTPAEGTKTVQQFYNETDESITNINNTLSTLSTSYQVTLTDDQGANSTYARVYTLSQNGSEIGTINIPKDQFLKKVEYSYAADGETPALVFTWNSSNPDATNDDTTYVPISDFIDAITEDIASDVTELQTRVNSIENAGYITGVTLDGVAGSNTNGVINLTSSLRYDEGTSTEIVSNGFLTMHGLTAQSTEPEP